VSSAQLLDVIGARTNRSRSAWHVNTDLSPLSLEEIKATVDDAKQGKKSKALWDAYKVASEAHDLVYFKNMLAEHEERRRQIEAEEAEREAKKAAKEVKKKTKDAAGDDDVEMEDAGENGEAVKKSSKKRKKETESDGDSGKVLNFPPRVINICEAADACQPSKTPKMKLKVNGPKTPTEDSATKPKKSKPKKPKAKADEEAEVTPAEPEMTEEEKREKKEKMSK